MLTQLNTSLVIFNKSSIENFKNPRFGPPAPPLAEVQGFKKRFGSGFGGIFYRTSRRENPLVSSELLDDQLQNRVWSWIKFQHFWRKLRALILTSKCSLMGKFTDWCIIFRANRKAWNPATYADADGGTPWESLDTGERSGGELSRFL